MSLYLTTIVKYSLGKSIISTYNDLHHSLTGTGPLRPVSHDKSYSRKSYKFS